MADSSPAEWPGTPVAQAWPGTPAAPTGGSPGQSSGSAKQTSGRFDVDKALTELGRLNEQVNAGAAETFTPALALKAAGRAVGKPYEPDVPRNPAELTARIGGEAAGTVADVVTLGRLLRLFPGATKLLTEGSTAARASKQAVASGALGTATSATQQYGDTGKVSPGQTAAAGGLSTLLGGALPLLGAARGFFKLWGSTEEAAKEALTGKRGAEGSAAIKPQGPDQLLSETTPAARPAAARALSSQEGSEKVSEIAAKRAGKAVGDLAGGAPAATAKTLARQEGSKVQTAARDEIKRLVDERAEKIKPYYDAARQAATGKEANLAGIQKALENPGKAVGTEGEQRLRGVFQELNESLHPAEEGAAAKAPYEALETAREDLKQIISGAERAGPDKAKLKAAAIHARGQVEAELDRLTAGPDGKALYAAANQKFQELSKPLNRIMGPGYADSIVEQQKWLDEFAKEPESVLPGLIAKGHNGAAFLSRVMKDRAPELVHDYLSRQLEKPEAGALQRLLSDDSRASFFAAYPEVTKDVSARYFADRLRELLPEGAEGVTVRNRKEISGALDSVTKEWERVRQTLVNNGVLKRDHAADVDTVMKGLDSLSGAMSRLPPQSELTSRASKAAVMGDAAQALAYGSGQLLGAKGWVAAKLVKTIGFFRKEQVEGLVLKALTDPAYARQLATPPPPPSVDDALKNIVGAGVGAPTVVNHYTSKRDQK